MPRIAGATLQGFLPTSSERRTALGGEIDVANLPGWLTAQALNCHRDQKDGDMDSVVRRHQGTEMKVHVRATRRHFLTIFFLWKSALTTELPLRKTGGHGKPLNGKQFNSEMPFSRVVFFLIL